MKHLHLALLAGTALLCAGAVPGIAQTPMNNFAPVTDQTLANPEAADWPSYGRNIQGYRFSPLAQINPDNVKSLQLVWSRGMEPGLNQIAPLEYKGVIYMGNPGDVIQAINAVSGELIWEHRRQLPDRKTLVNQLGERKRGIALYDDKVYFVSWDNVVVALDAKTGKVAWEANRGDSKDGVSNATGLIVANGVVIAGSTCQYSGRGCYTTGHDAKRGEELWRNTFIPRPGQPGDETWAGAPYESRWMTGAWGQVTYDPELDLAFYGSSGTGPASETQRGMPGATQAGTNTRWAVRPKTGEVVWRHQTLPRDNWDQECTFEMLPVTTNVSPDPTMEGLKAIGAAASGNQRRVLTGVPCKTGLMWNFDAKTGEFLYVRDTVVEDIVDKVDPKGIVTVREDKILKEIGVKMSWCPSHNGGKDWPPAAYNPNSGILFVPLINICQDSTPRRNVPSPTDVYNVDSRRYLPAGKSNAGRIEAINVATGKTAWTWETYAPTYSPIMATGTNLLFTGGLDRYFRAIDQRTGKEIWQTRLPASVQGHAITYEVGGRQYVAVPAGGGGAAANLEAVQGVDHLSGSNALFVFALPQN